MELILLGGKGLYHHSNRVRVNNCRSGIEGRDGERLHFKGKHVHKRRKEQNG